MLRRRGLVRAEPALRGHVLQALPDGGHRTVGDASNSVEEPDLVPGERRDLRDPGAHRPGADHADRSCAIDGHHAAHSATAVDVNMRPGAR
jgi:hypothetical protein